MGKVQQRRIAADPPDLDLAFDEDSDAIGVAVTPRGRPVVFSNALSADAGTISLLAITESLVAMGVYGWIAVRHGTLHLAVAACLTPLLLLRTKSSTRVALDWHSRIRRSSFGELALFLGLVAVVVWIATMIAAMTYTGFQNLPQMLRVVIGLSLLSGMVGAALTLPIKVAATLYCFVLHPIQTISEVPGRWWRVVLCTDALHPPELLPGASLSRSRDPSTTFLLPFALVRQTIDDTWSPWGFGAPRWLRAALLWPVLVTTIVGLALPALLYRWSLKGTALIWFPLVWAVSESLERTPERVCASKFASFSRKVAGGVLALLAGKAVYMTMGLDVGAFRQLLRAAHRADFVQHLLASNSWPIWQVLLGLVSGLSFISYWYADRLKNRDRGRERSAVLDALFTLQASFSVVAIALLVLLVVGMVHETP